MPVAVRTFVGVWLIANGTVADAQDVAADGAVQGPHGTYLLPSPSPGIGTQSVTFEQMSSKALDGQVVNSDSRFAPSQLPATFTARFKDGSFCTATLVGPRVLLTAAHCIDQKVRNDEGVWTTVPGGIRLAGEAASRPFKSCQMAPAYIASKPKLVPAPRNSHDFALCELTEVVPLKAESLELKGALASSMPLLIAGYGCSEEDLAGGKIPPRPTSGLILRAGMNRIRAEKIASWITLIGRVGTSDAVICPGDSGGGAYKGATLQARAYSEGWRLVAVNSAVGPSSFRVTKPKISNDDTKRRGAEYISYLSPLSDGAFSELVASFMKLDNASRAICGINRSAPRTRCRP